MYERLLNANYSLEHRLEAEGIGFKAIGLLVVNIATNETS